MQAVSLNSTPADQIRPGSLVRFRCMVQDAYDPEIYLDTFEAADPQGNRSLHCGRYRDNNSSIPTDATLVDQSRHNVLRNRQTLYCVPIPGEAEWVKRQDAPAAGALPTPATEPERRISAKRGLDADDDDSMEMEDNGQAVRADDAAAAAVAATGPAIKKTRDEQQAGGGEAAASGGFHFNFPLPGETGTAVMAKFYGDEGQIPTINQMVEVLGFYEIDPVIGMADFSDDPFDMAEEHKAKNPPASLIPRLHCLRFAPIAHNNPHLGQAIAPEVRADAMAAAPGVRANLLATIGAAIGGDQLVSEFILLHLLSAVHTRQDGSTLVLGKLPMNVLGMTPESHGAIKHLNDFLRQVLPNHHAQSMELAQLEAIRMNPKKNVMTNRLDAGLLQLAAGTNLVLDECVMNEGNLKEQGINNLKALAQLMQNQTLQFQFEFTPIDFEVDIPVLVFSEGKSLLPVDLHVPYRPGAAPPRPVAPSEAELVAFRNFITLARTTEHIMTDEVRTRIETDFVQMRQEDPEQVKAETLHTLLIVARLMSQSYCNPTLSTDIWDATRTLEAARRATLDVVAPVAKHPAGGAPVVPTGLAGIVE